MAGEADGSSGGERATLLRQSLGEGGRGDFGASDAGRGRRQREAAADLMKAGGRAAACGGTNATAIEAAEGDNENGEAARAASVARGSRGRGTHRCDGAMEQHAGDKREMSSESDADTRWGSDGGEAMPRMTSPVRRCDAGGGGGVADSAWEEDGPTGEIRRGWKAARRRCSAKSERRSRRRYGVRCGRGEWRRRRRTEIGEGGGRNDGGNATCCARITPEVSRNGEQVGRGDYDAGAATWPASVRASWIWWRVERGGWRRCG